MHGPRTSDEAWFLSWSDARAVHSALLEGRSMARGQSSSSAGIKQEGALAGRPRAWTKYLAAVSLELSGERQWRASIHAPSVTAVEAVENRCEDVQRKIVVRDSRWRSSCSVGSESQCLRARVQHRQARPHTCSPSTTYAQSTQTQLQAQQPAQSSTGSSFVTRSSSSAIICGQSPSQPSPTPSMVARTTA